MNKVYKEIKSLIDSALLDLGIECNDYIIEHPADSSKGDYACNVGMRAFSKARGISDNPVDFSKRILFIIEKSISKNIDKVEVAGQGFINFYLSKEFLIRNMFDVRSVNGLLGNRKKISLEHTQINPNKEPHIGHLRNACIGDSLSKILTFVGNEVSVQYYQNDVGQQIASIVLAYKKQFVPIDDISLLNCEDVLVWASMAYVDIENRIELSSDLKLEKEELQKRIVSQTSKDSDLAHKITEAILKATLMLFSELSIEYDLIVKESDIIRSKLWERTFDLLKANPNFYRSQSGEREGCWLIRMPNSEDKVIVRSNGIPTYTGNDIAYHLWKFGALPDFLYEILNWKTQQKLLYTTNSKSGKVFKKRFNSADSIVNIIDTTQTYPQESVKEALRILGYANYAENYNHVNYGFVFLKDKASQNEIVKMSGRKGTVIKISNFVDMLTQSLTKQFGQFSAISDVAIGAIKFEMLKYDTYQDVVFDIEEAIDQKGFSGPYIQYTYARAQSVVSKYVDPSSVGVDKCLFLLDNLNDTELDLLRLIFRFEDVVLRASSELAPHYICKYLFDLSKSFNTFYNSSKIIGSKSEDFRVALTLSVSDVLLKCMNLVGMPAPKSLR